MALAAAINLTNTSLIERIKIQIIPQEDVGLAQRSPSHQIFPERKLH
jgi:hypothetical protein